MARIANKADLAKTRKTFVVAMGDFDLLMRQPTLAEMNRMKDSQEDALDQAAYMAFSLAVTESGEPLFDSQADAAENLTADQLLTIANGIATLSDVETARKNS